MANSGMSSFEKNVLLLEKVNGFIDLCIDNECYEAINKIIPDDKLSNPEIIVTLRGIKPESGSTGEERETAKDISKYQLGYSALELGNASYPVRQVALIPDFQKIYQGQFSNNPVMLDGDPFLKPWSSLLWVKLIRAELLKQNRNPWLKHYDNVIMYLENNIVLCLSEGKDATGDTEDSRKRTLLNYLMELSATSTGEASLGYAERARNLSNEVLRDSKAREDYGDPYDRWIWYNKGIAYQHTVRNEEAIGQFSVVIDKFIRQYGGPHGEPPLVPNTDACIEYLLNIAPAIMQTAAIYIKRQLAYHALKFLADKSLDRWLNNVSDEYKGVAIIGEVVEKLKLRAELLRLEALLRLGNLGKSENKIRCLYETVKTNSGNGKHDELPAYDPAKPPSTFQVRFIEQKVIWYRENAKQLLDDIKHTKKPLTSYDEKKKEEIKSGLKLLVDRMNAIGECYWSWVQDNPHDENVYYSNWAQFLGIGMNIIRALIEQKQWLSWAEECGTLLKAIVNLYNKHRASLPDSNGKSKIHSKKRIVLERLRSDDPFDIVGGLNDFYEGVIFIFFNEKAVKAREIMISERISCDQFRNDHFQLLGALDKFNRVFGEDQNIEALNRCNRRVKWIAGKESDADCHACLGLKYGGAWLEFFNLNGNKKGFKGLLYCCGKENNKQDDSLHSDDYENIMSEAEEQFSKHLKDNSSHLPEKKALHFMGLQRWNSLTPAQGRSVGGGYFIYHTDDRGEIDLGIAIDPGFDFVRNLFRQGFSIRDIDIVLISHAHADHLWDFESIVQLLHDLSEKKRIEHRNHRIHVVLTRGVYQRYERHVIENHALRRFIEPLVIDLRQKQIDEFVFKENIVAEKLKQPYRWTLKLDGSQDRNQIDNESDEPCEIETVVIKPTFAYHDDYSRISDSYGFIIKFQKSGQSFCFGYTGDTKWVGDDLYEKECPARTTCNPQDDKCQSFENIASQYLNCDALLIHLGSLIDHKNEKRFSHYKEPKECSELIRKKNHPYLPGMIRFLRKVESSEKPEKLILIGEFGEELRGGIRVDIVKRLKTMLRENVPVLPVDVGLDILLWEKECQFICALCNKSKSWKKIEYERYGYDEAIFYVCHTCFKAYPIDVRQDRYRKLYDVGKELTVLPDKPTRKVQIEAG